MHAPKWAAYHEAGHAVAWWILLREAVPVHVRTVDGRIVAAAVVGERAVSHYVDALACVCAAAGPAADVIYSHVSASLAYLRGGISDDRAIEESIAYWGDPATAAGRYASAARRMLRRHWPRVVAVAEALYVSGELSAERVSALLGAHVHDSQAVADAIAGWTE